MERATGVIMTAWNSFPSLVKRANKAIDNSKAEMSRRNYRDYVMKQDQGRKDHEYQIQRDRTELTREKRVYDRDMNAYKQNCADVEECEAGLNAYKLKSDRINREQGELLDYQRQMRVRSKKRLDQKFQKTHHLLKRKQARSPDEYEKTYNYLNPKGMKGRLITEERNIRTKKRDLETREGGYLNSLYKRQTRAKARYEAVHRSEPLQNSWRSTQYRPAAVVRHTEHAPLFKRQSSMNSVGSNHSLYKQYDQ